MDKDGVLRALGDEWLMYTRHTGVFGRAARPSHPMAALSLLAIGRTMTRRDALPWGANEVLR